MGEYNDNLQAQLDAAQEMLNANMYEDAWLVLNRLDSEYPDSPEILATMGDAALKLADFEFAYEMFDRVIELEPVWSEAWSARARCRLEMCELQGARMDLERALLLDPANPEAHYCMAILAEFDDDSVAALHQYTQAAMLDPDHFGPPFTARSKADFERVVASEIAKITQEPDYAAIQVNFEVTDLPDLDFCLETGFSPLITSFSPDDKPMNGKVTITFFRKNIERVCRNRNDLKNEIQTALITELLPLTVKPLPLTDDHH